MKHAGLFLRCVVIALVVGCASAAKDWKVAQETNTPQAYEAFLKKHAKSEYTADASAALDALEWDEVLRLQDLTRCARYAEKHPNKHVREMQEMATAIFQSKIANEKGSGKRVVHHARAIDVNLEGMSGASQSEKGCLMVPVLYGIMWLSGGDLQFGPVLWYSDPGDPLAVHVRKSGFEHYKGKGIGITSDSVYCFGF